jgi:tetratricopeptide (TPR) repeat protein
VQLKDIATRDTTNYLIYRLLGYSYYRTTDYPSGLSAMTHFFRVVKQNKIIDSDYIYYGHLQSKNNMDSLAVITYNKAVSIDTSDCTLRAELANMLYKDKKYVDAVNAWKNDIRCLKDQAGLNEYFKLGLSYYLSNQFGKADSTFKYAEKFNATWIQLPLFRARSQEHIDTDMSLGTAKALYDSSLVLALKDSVHNIPALVEIYTYDGFYVLQVMKNKDKEYTEPMKQKAYAQSIEYFNKVLALDPNNAPAKQALDQINETLKAAKVQQQNLNRQSH